VSTNEQTIVHTAESKTETTATFDAWLDSFFESYYRRRPVNATFIGVHDYDHCLPDFSPNGAADTLAEMQSLLTAASQLPAEPLTHMQKIDKRLCEGFLRIQCWDYQGNHFCRGNPSLYVSEAIFGVLSLFLSDYDSLGKRVDAATERLDNVQALLRQGIENIHSAPATWTKQAITECIGAIEFLSGGALQAAGSAATRNYSKGIESAIAAFSNFKSHLEVRLKNAPPNIYSAGDDALSLHLRDAHYFDQDADEIIRYAETQLNEASAYLSEHAVDFDETQPGVVLQRLHSIHPTLDNYYERYQEVWDDIHQIVVDKELLTWPDFPLRYTPEPTWVRNAAPHLYFLYYRSPAAFHRPPVHDYLVTPIDNSMSEEMQRNLLRSNNDSAIKLNHVVHHGGIGHHIQNWHAFRSTSRVGQIAAIDCASRIAMNCGGTMAEGWACYATDLIGEAGGISDLESYAEKYSRVRMSARAIVDIRLHQGRFTFEQAVGFYKENASMSTSAAISETTRNSMYPGSAVIYLTGCDAIHALKAQLKKMRGNRFNLCDFHDRFLSFGSIPVALIAEAMLEQENAAMTRETSE